MPSTYTVLGWVTATVLYVSVANTFWKPLNGITVFLIVVFVTVAALSVLVLGHRFSSAAARSTSLTATADEHHVVAVACHAVGLGALFYHLYSLGTALSTIGGFQYLLFVAPHEIRWANEDLETFGTQLSYFGWIGCGISGLLIGLGRYRTFHIGLTVVQFLANLAYIDRTRPTWIGISFLLMLALGRATRHGLPLDYVVRTQFRYIVGAATVMFVLIGVWVGKIATDIGFWSLDARSPMGSVVVYATSGIAYLNDLLATAVDPDFVPRRILYPAFKLASKLSLAETPPSQILEYKDLPTSTNVATILEPFFSDGGVFYLFLAIPLLTFGIDLAALSYLSSRTAAGRFVWANLLLTALLGFFVSKISSSPLWLIVAFHAMYSMSRPFLKPTFR